MSYSPKPGDGDHAEDVTRKGVRMLGIGSVKEMPPHLKKRLASKMLAPFDRKSNIQKCDNSHTS